MATTREFGGDGDDIRSSTFSITGEDHTLGNSLRFILNKDSRVSFCGYSVPHPADNRVNIRVQTTGAAARVVFKDAVQDLMTLSSHVSKTFQNAVTEYKATRGLKDMSMGTSTGVTSQTVASTMESGVTHEAVSGS